MKITIIADCHLNKAIYKAVPDKDIPDLPFRTVDYMKSFEYMVDENIKSIKPDLIVIAGDVYDTFDPSNLVRTFFNNQLKKLNDAKIPVIVLVGNHDICRKHHALKPIDALGIKGVKVIESPRIILFKDKILALFPYSMEVERGDIEIKEQFYNFIKEIKNKVALNDEFKDKELLFFGHFGVRGAKLNEYNEIIEEETTTTTTLSEVHKQKKDFINSNNKDIGLDDLDNIGAKYVFLGDYHQHQILNTKKCIALYTGSIEKTDMTEKDHKKGFIVYDTDMPQNEIKTMGNCKFIEYPNCRPMIELVGTMSEIESQLDKCCKSQKGAIVKITFVGNSEELTTFSIGLEPLKKKLRFKIDPIHMWHQQKVIDVEEKNAATALESEIMNKGHLESDDVLNVVDDMIKEKIKDEKEILILFEMANNIYKETMIKDK